MGECPPEEVRSVTSARTKNARISQKDDFWRTLAVKPLVRFSKKQPGIWFALTCILWEKSNLTTEYYC